MSYFLSMFLPPLLASSWTRWQGPTDTTIPRPTVSTCTRRRSLFPRPPPPRRQQLNRNPRGPLSQTPPRTRTGSSLNWNAPTPPRISPRTWEMRSRRKPPPPPPLLSHPPSTERPSKALGCFLISQYKYGYFLFVLDKTIIWPKQIDPAVVQAWA